MEEARVVLKRFFGYEDFRRGQVDVVASVLSGRETLGVLPTGGGKSLCYQVPALVFPGMTVVISPLISLMKDQVDRLQHLGVAATFLNSTLDATDVRDRLERARRGAIKLLYVAPERFEAADLGRCLERCRLSLLAVDEAHCISEWGHEFRPSFRRIAGVAQSLRIPLRMALTATATPLVRRDIVAQLRMRQPNVIVAGFDRVNLSYAVARRANDVEKQAALVQTLKSFEKPAIVYAPTRAAVERVSRRVARTGLRTLPYHGGLTADHRQNIQDRFMAGEVDCLVATNAFGMGIDKPNVRLVVHFAMPGTLEAYYQEAGRAGRDGQHGHCVLLHAPDDRSTHEFFITRVFPRRRDVEDAYDEARRTHVDGVIHGMDPSIARFLELTGAVSRQSMKPQGVRVRLLATPSRIAREYAPAAPERRLLRDLWRRTKGTLAHGAFLDTTMLETTAVKPLLTRLQERQFLHVNIGGNELRLTDPAATLRDFEVDWAAVERRRTTESAKLDAMEGYVHTRECRRAFVLRYFGETVKDRRCGGCDNCQTAL